MANLLSGFGLDYNSLPHAGACDPAKSAAACQAASHAYLMGILNVVYAVAGAIALIIITMAGIQYIISQGDPQKTAKAKNTILYAAIGLAIAVLASVITNFVIKGLTS